MLRSMTLQCLKLLLRTSWVAAPIARVRARVQHPLSDSMPEHRRQCDCGDCGTRPPSIMFAQLRCAAAGDRRRCVATQSMDSAKPLDYFLPYSRYSIAGLIDADRQFVRRNFRRKKSYPRPGLCRSNFFGWSIFCSSLEDAGGIGHGKRVSARQSRNLALGAAACGFGHARSRLRGTAAGVIDMAVAWLLTSLSISGAASM